MGPFARFGAIAVCALSAALPTTLQGGPAPATAVAQSERGGTRPALLAWREAPDMKGLIAELERWLDRHANLPRRARPPQVRLVSAAEAAALRFRRDGVVTAGLRGLYDPDAATILLVRPWDPRDPHDVGVLLHELVHHRQAEHGHWYCPGAQELPAYRLQEAWLAQLGLRARVNWIAVVLEAGCTVRDFHPD